MKAGKFLIAAMVAASLIQPVLPVSADDGITIRVNGSTIQTQTPPVISNDRTLVPLRAISDALGCDIAWDSDTRGITITDGSALTYSWIGKDNGLVTTATIILGYVPFDAPPVIMNDYTMVPVRALSEIFGAQVDWDDTSRTVDITYTLPPSGLGGLAEKFKTYEQVLYKKYDAYVGYAQKNGNVVNAEIQLENGGTVELELYPDIAPETVANFVKLANQHYYDGLIFHRVIKDFMIQGGGYDTNYAPKETATITGEFIANGYLNLIHHSRGVISMARRGDSYDSAAGQFFIMHADTESLDGQYAAFGKVTSGMEYVDAIAETPTDSNATLGATDVPVEQQVIKTVVIK